MKILIVTQCFYPDIYAVNDIVAQLTQRGHTVTVLTGLPDYTTSKIPKEYKWFRNRRQQFGGAQVYRVSTIARHHGAIFRCLNYLSFAISGGLYAWCKRWDDFDVIYVWEVSPVTMAIPAICLKRRFHKPLFLYCMDLWPESIKAMGFREGSLFYTLVHKLSRWIYRQCDHIAVSSTPFFGYLEQENGILRDKMSYLPQYASTELLEQDLEKPKDGHTDFLFIGNVGKVQDVEVIIRACALLKEDARWTMHIVGSGSNLESCKQLAHSEGLDGRVLFHGSCPMQDTPRFYSKADACILTLNGDNMIGSTLPGKLQTYMAAGKPVIAAINGAGRQVIEQSGCGLCVAAGDAEGLARVMRQFAENPAQYAACGQNGRRYFRTHFTKEQHFETLENVLEELSEGRTLLEVGR